ncbi:hypothetical protein J1N35_026576 [Gossypium stocksii]|uniref:Uncharacterized protein n=1 Tax=Gossypium stocksii TaxID=47602 RepID=A0A9D3VAU4_9ROSI|nr:hypothetical protein J1N35_026576 [Gossypium stocksii]
MDSLLQPCRVLNSLARRYLQRLNQSLKKGTMNGLWELPHCSTLESRLLYGQATSLKDSGVDEMSGLPYRYYNKKLLRIIARTLGKVVKVN